MENNKYKIWDLIIKVVSSILAISSIVFGVYKFTEQNERELRKKIYEEQYEIYSETIELAAHLSTTDDLDSVSLKNFQITRHKFEVLYYGKLCLIQDITVEKAIVNFHDALIRFESGDSSIEPETLQQLSINLANAFRRSLEKTWGISFPELRMESSSNI